MERDQLAELKAKYLPTRERASLILTKSANHAVERSDYANNLQGSEYSPFLFFALRRDISPPIQGFIIPSCSRIKPPVCLFRVKCQIFLYHQYKFHWAINKIIQLFPARQIRANPSCSKSSNAARNSRISMAPTYYDRD